MAPAVYQALWDLCLQPQLEAGCQPQELTTVTVTECQPPREVPELRRGRTEVMPSYTEARCGSRGKSLVIMGQQSRLGDPASQNHKIF